MAKIALLSHDAGGAELVSHWAKSNTQHEYIIHVGGPAKKIFKKNIPNYDSKNMDELLEADFLLCGTSWASSIELEGIKLFKENKKLAIAFIDHWVFYAERFILKNTEVLPDKIWVADNHAAHIAKKNFSNKVEIKNIGNPYLDNIIRSINAGDQIKNDKVKILYICEPIKEQSKKQHQDEMYIGYHEFTALDYFLNKVDKLLPFYDEIVFRPHPSENSSKYAYLQEYSNKFIIGGKSSLLDEIASSTFVVGCESMAMVIALHAGKEVFSCIPPQGKNCSLPFKEIIHFKHIDG